jgi:hypothetical protein
MPYLKLSSANLPDPAIDPAQGSSPQDYFNTVLYTGNGGTQSITGFGFQPDFVWDKSRNNAYSHMLYDSIRGVGKYLRTNLTNAEVDDASTLTSFDSDGVTVGDINGNSSGSSSVMWAWKANGSGVSNTDGSITSTVSANTESGFSIMTYTGNGTNGATVGHGLSQAPEFVIVKPRNQAENWNVQAQGLRLNLNSTGAGIANYLMGFVSSTVTLTDLTYQNGNGYSMLMYAFHSVEGFSKFGSYTGNGSSDGPFVYTGFRPAYILMKRTDSTGTWWIYDTARSTYNVVNDYFQANTSNAEGTNNSLLDIDLLSNGFKLRSSYASINASGGSHIYMAFAENPFKYSNAR